MPIRQCTSVFRNIYGPPGPTENSNGGVAGYPAIGPGWNACTGWGSPKGKALLEAFTLYYFHGSNWKRTNRDAPIHVRSAGKGPAGGRIETSHYPAQILAGLNSATVKVFEGVVDSVVVQPPYLAVGIYNRQQNSIQGFLIPDTTIQSQAYVIESLFDALQSKNRVNVYYNDPGATIYAVVIDAP
ncbi:MAG: hypothetical protein ABSG53_27500 [Thermoguttaceae bacterium]